ncbi:sugar transferase [Mycobacterium sp. PSTR-4-N]|uniref:sugar transferase n=1 Tax=Mycobacterium sp. PSTR-4-N TaxID=2917745 RepID=UPI001F14B9B9|nr:sugar transferase [Mycobacterium sp. PSTR-4-N]MCG7592777.1 sugar transferase [Mycobacterium sp. PSTR-4-N]
MSISEIAQPEQKPVPTTPTLYKPLDWHGGFAWRVRGTDCLAVFAALAAAQFLRFGSISAEVGDFGLANYTTVSVVIALLWLASLWLNRTVSTQVVGLGYEEYQRVIVSTLGIFGFVAIVSMLLKLEIARGYLAIALPVGMALLLCTRWCWRRWLAAKRKAGEYVHKVLILGSRATAEGIARDLIQNPTAGYHVVAAVVPGRDVPQRLPGTTIPLTNDVDNLVQLMSELGADTLLVTSSDALPPSRIREIGWALEPGRQHLVIAPGLTDVCGPRMHMHHVAGLPLVHVETPVYEGVKLLAKRTIDFVGSAVLLLVFSPVLFATAISIKVTDRGPVFFSQVRAGYGGEPFRMLKFRSMVVNAEALQAELERRNESDGAVFKIKDDPRITTVGRFIRRYSIDELPQLFNVLCGSMSLVGPRPHPLRDVERYDGHIHRRFLVKPGVTGLWQVSGRSSLSWEQAVRLDLYYVENWSVTTDLAILWRTFKAVVGKDGAY